MCKIEKGDDLEKLNVQASFQSQVKEFRLQDKLEKQHFHDKMKEVFEHAADTVKETPKEATKTLMVTSKVDSKAPAIPNDHFLEKMKDKSTLASYLLSPSSQTANSKEIGQFEPVKSPTSYRVNDFSKIKTIHTTLYDSLLTLRGDTSKKFEMEGDFSKMVINKSNNVDFADSSDQIRKLNLRKKCISMRRLQVTKKEINL